MHQGVISPALHMVRMLFVRWRTYVNEAAMNLARYGCLLNEPTCINGI